MSPNAVMPTAAVVPSPRPVAAFEVNLDPNARTFDAHFYGSAEGSRASYQDLHAHIWYFAPLGWDTRNAKRLDRELRGIEDVLGAIREDRSA